MGEIYRELGRLCVTITDLEVLIADLSRYRAQGYFMLLAGTRVINSPEELRTLADSELRQLSLTRMSLEGPSQDLVVWLQIDKAAAVGKAFLVNRVQEWAEVRQFVGLPPRAVLPRRTTRCFTGWRFRTFTTCLIQMTLWFLVATAETGGRRSLYAWLGVGSLVSLAGSTYVRIVAPRDVTNFALVVPLTLEEHRKEDLLRRRYLITMSIALAAPVIASLTAFAVVLIKS